MRIKRVPIAMTLNLAIVLIFRGYLGTLCNLSARNLAGGLVFCLVRGYMREGCFHYIRCLEPLVGLSGLGDGSFVPGAGVDSDGGEGPGL